MKLDENILSKTFWIELIFQLKTSWNETIDDWASLADEDRLENAGDKPFNTAEDRLPNTRIQLGIQKMMMNWLLKEHPNHGMFGQGGPEEIEISVNSCSSIYKSFDFNLNNFELAMNLNIRMNVHDDPEMFALLNFLSMETLDSKFCFQSFYRIQNSGL